MLGRANAGTGACGLFAVPNSFEFDRQIINPIPENSRSMTVSDNTKSLGRSRLSCGICFDRGEVLVTSSDDLEDFFHCFSVPPAHALRNHFAGIFRAEEFLNFRACDPALAGLEMVGCFNTFGIRVLT